MKYSDGKLTIDCADTALFKHLVNAALAFDSKKPKAARPSPIPKVGCYTVGTVLHEYDSLKRNLDCGGCVTRPYESLVYRSIEGEGLCFWSDKWEKSSTSNLHGLLLPVVATEAPDGNHTLGTELTGEQAKRHVRRWGLIETDAGTIISRYGHLFWVSLPSGQPIDSFTDIPLHEKYTVIG